MSDLVRHAPDAARSRVLRLVRLLQADRPGWKPTPVTLDLWVEEFAGVSDAILIRAGRAWLRRSDSLPSLAGIWKAIHEQQEADRYKHAPLPDPATLERYGTSRSLAEVQRKHPWYEPDLSFNELLLRCQSWRRSRAAQGLGHYDANGRWTDRPQEGMG